MGIVMNSRPPVAQAVPRPPQMAGSMFSPIEADLEAAERVFHGALASYRSPIAPIVQHLKHYRGKRLRPALLLLTARACGRITPAHHTLAAAVEMIHTATLVHDDVLDEAELRRHVPTVNAGWGNKISILLGDMLFTHAFHLTSTVDVRACQISSEATNRVCAGELRQVSERGNLHLPESEYFAIIEGKTAALTECCGRLGSVYAGASEEVVDRMAAYAWNLGLAFQIADDLLDLMGEETTAGKTLGTDLEEQKLTLPVIHCLSRLSAGEAEQLRSVIRRGGPGVGTTVLKSLDKTQSIAYARWRAEELAVAARRQLECLPRSECKVILESLTEWALRREK